MKTLSEVEEEIKKVQAEYHLKCVGIGDAVIKAVILTPAFEQWYSVVKALNAKNATLLAVKEALTPAPAPVETVEVDEPTPYEIAAEIKAKHAK